MLEEHVTPSTFTTVRVAAVQATAPRAAPGCCAPAARQPMPPRERFQAGSTDGVITVPPTNRCTLPRFRMNTGMPPA